MKAHRALGGMVWVLASSFLAAAESPPATVGRGTGLLAVSEQGGVAGSWRILDADDPLPAECVARTAGVGPCVVRAAESTLQLGPDTRVKWSLSRREVVVRQGQVCLASGRQAGWSLTAAPLRITLAADSTAEVRRATAGPATLTLLAGAAEGVTTGGKTLTLNKPAIVTCRTGEDEVRVEPLDAAARARVGDWTKSSPAPPGLGQLLVQDAQSQSSVRLSVARYHMHVVLQPPVALVQIDQSFYNPFDRQQEGQFVFNLPRGASVSRFAMYVTPRQLIEGELIERQRASQVYQTIVSQRRDPAILEQLGDNLFKMRVFPVFARDEKRILLDYTLPLEIQAGTYRFRVPLLSDAAPIWDFRITGAIRGAVRPQSAASDSHPDLSFRTHAGGTVAFEFHRKEYRPETDFVLSFAAPADRPAALRSYVAEPLAATGATTGDSLPADEWSQRKALYFLAEIPPAADLPPAPPADVLVLADTSSSMKELAPMRQAVREIVESLRPQDRVRLVCGDVATRPLHEGWLEPLGGTAAGRDGAAAGRPPRQTGKPQGEGGKKAARRAKRRAAEQEGIPSRRLLSALEQLDAQFALGGTNLDSCLREAVASFEDAAGARRRLLIYVGDGVDESGRPQESAAWKTLAERLEEAQTVFVALIVRRPAKPQAHLAQLAAASGGLMFDLADDLRAPRELFRWLLAGLPTPERILQAAVAGAKPEDVYCPGTWVPGQPLYVYGRMPEGREVQLSLTLGRGSQKRTQQVTLAAPAGQDDVFVGRLWAQRRLEQWLRLDLDKDQDARKRVLALSQEWSLLSPYTAFLVLESEQDYQRWQVDRRARRRYWRPADARPEAPLPPSWVDRVTAPRKGKTAEERPLSTLRDAREATNAGRYSQALDLLLQMKHAPQAKSAEYDRLRERAVTGLRARDFVESLGLHRGLFDPAAKTPGWALRPSVMSLVAGAHYRDPDFFRRRPHAEKLCQDVDLGAFAKPQSLAGFADVLRRLTGTNVVLDREAMKQAGVDVDSRLEPLNVQCDSAPAPDNPFTAPPRPGSGGRKKPRAGADEDPFAQPADQSAPREPSKPREPAQLPAGKMSLRSFVHHRLKALDLVLSEEPHRLLITTKENLPSTTEVYPVADLLFTDRVAPPELLSNPLVDHFEKARRRIEGKLKQPVTLDYVEVPLRDVAADLAARLAEPVLLDSKALAQAGIDQDRPVTASYREVPAQKALQWLLHDHDVVFTVWDDVLVITTKEEADARLVVQLHSGRGLLYEFPMPANAASQWQGPTGFGPTPFGAGRSSRGRAQAHGFGGGMGGMGGMAGSGMGSMGSMGSMFGGGTSRPYVTGVIPAVDGSKLSGTAGLSTGGDGTAAPSAPDKHPLAEPELAVMGGVAGGAAVAYDYDRDTLVDLVTSTIAPQSWDSVGGPGCVDFFPATLDFVFAQTREVHEQVAELFERLRRLPVQASAKSGARPATVHPQVVEDFSHADFDTLIDLITSTLEPQSWDSVGGAGSIEAEPTRVALVVSQTPDVHQQLSRLLLLLRRSRYESVRGGQPWEAELGPTTRGPAAAEATPADVSEPRRLVDFPAANLAELAALRARRDPAAGRWRWRRVVADSTRSEVAFRSAGPRCEFGFGSATVRTEGDLAAVAWPRLKLVEHGNYAEVLRRAMDAQLPWMPHRSNEELARLFEVFERPPDSSLARRAGAEETGPDGPTGAPSPASAGQPDVVWLRLIPAGLPRDGDTYLQIAYSRTERLPVQWEAYVAGKRTGRIWFEDPVRDGTLAEWRKAILEDAEGRELVRWELIEAKAEGGVIPELTSGWDGYIHLDCRAPRPILDAPFVEAVTALRESHWDRAAELLQRLPEETERHPLVRLLRAWCIEHDEGLGSRSLLATLLRTAAQDDAPEVLRFIAEGNFRSLSDAARYALMTSQPEPSRTGDDYDRLAHVATGLGKLPEALACIDVALKRGEGDAQVPARQRLRIELLLRLGRTTEAVADAERWLTPGRAATEDVATVAELFAAHAQPATAERLFHAALADRRLTAEQRYGLLLRAAAARQGSERCRALLEAASLQPPGSSGRTACLQQLRQELATPAHAGIAAQLMAYTEDAELIAELLVREAELTQDKNRAGDLAWQVYESGRLGDTRLDWACRLWQQAGQAERVIRTCEAALRAGRSLRSTTQDALAQAYRESGRPSDARRAASRDVPPQPAEPTRPPPGMGGGMF